MKKSSIHIKVDRITPRIAYTFDFVFKQRGIDYELITGEGITDLDYRQNQPNCSELLYQESLPFELPVFDSSLGVFSFNGKVDYFASVFFVLSRMEEYLISDRDEHGRFSAKNSVLYKHDLLKDPICDEWARHILENSLGIEVPKQAVSIEPTFDIDNSFAYKFKSGSRRMLSIARDVVKLDKKRLSERREVEKGGRDPYDTFDQIISIAKRFETTKVFWLIRSDGKYDRNLRIDEPNHIALIKKVNKFAEVNIHPSYYSFGSLIQLSKERTELSALLGNEVLKSRQHYLRFTLPQSYQSLIEAGIHEDYSMGFADAVGFRCGTARSINWFDLSKDIETELRVHPFTYMDGTLNEYLGLSVKESKELVKELYHKVEKFGGVFRCIWHNETIGNYGKWKDWNSVLEYTLKLSDE